MDQEGMREFHLIAVQRPTMGQRLDQDGKRLCLSLMQLNQVADIHTDGGESRYFIYCSLKLKIHG